MIDVTIGVRGGQAISRKLGLAASIVGDLTPIFQKYGHPFLLSHMRRQFLTAGRHGGAAWRGYDQEPIYRYYKRAIVGHLEVLRWESGFERLAPSLMEARHKSHIFAARRDSMRFGTSVPYAFDLNKGGRNLFGEPMPPRQIIAFRESQKKEFISELQRGIVATLGAGSIRSARLI